MAQILKIFGMLAGIIPMVLALIKEFETPGFGPEKKKVILDTISLLYDQLAITIMTKEKLLGIVGGFIDIAVAFFNVVGWFKHGNPIPSS